ncbi:MAG: hypothetical protein PSV35_01365, partial [bacterium]|nr:hypothetical protein [bacterium]
MGSLTIENHSSITADTYASSGHGGGTAAFGVIGAGDIVIKDSSVTVHQRSTASNLGDTRSIGLLNYKKNNIISNITV